MGVGHGAKNLLTLVLKGKMVGFFSANAKSFLEDVEKPFSFPYLFSELCLFLDHFLSV